MHLSQRSAQDREVLRRQVDQLAVDPTEAGHHAVARDFFPPQPEVLASQFHKAAHLDKATLVKQVLDPFPDPQFPPVPLGLQTRFTASQAHGRLALAQSFNPLPVDPVCSPAAHFVTHKE